MSFLLGMVSAVIVFVLQGPFGSNILDVIIGELNFTLDGMKYLLCQASSVCRSGGI
jgi:hypothetical protein